MTPPVRRAHALVGTWEGSDFVVQNYVTGGAATLSPLVAHALGHASEFVSRAAIAARIGLGSAGRGIVQALVDGDILLARGSDNERLDQRIEDSWAWPHDARFFHFSARQTAFRDDFAAERDELAVLAQSTPPPPPFVTTGGDSIALPRTVPSGELWDALRARRTRRRFRRAPIARRTLATILEWTWGATHVIDDPEIGLYALKTSPSGGARHPTEVYVIVQRVRGVAPGVYHYHAGEHRLELLRRGRSESRTVALCANQPWVADAAVVFVMTASLPRSMWKYRQSHAYRVVLLDMGHLGQTFHLVCTALGLAPFTSGATNEAALEEALGVDPAREPALYVAATGLPAK